MFILQQAAERVAEASLNLACRTDGNSSCVNVNADTAFMAVQASLMVSNMAGYKCSLYTSNMQLVLLYL